MPEKGTIALRDLAIALVSTGGTLAAGLYFDLFENFAEWVQRYERWQIDEIIFVPLALGFAFGLFYWLRWRALKNEVAERERAEEALQESYAMLQAVTEGTSSAIYVKDRHSRYLMINSAGANIFGKPVEEVICKDDSELFGPDAGRHLIEDDRRIMAGGETHTYEEVIPLDDGDDTRVYWTTKGVYRDHRGDVAGVFGISRDVTEYRRVEETLRQSEDQLAKAQQIAQLGSWDWEPATGEVIWSDELYRLYGRSPEDSSFQPGYEDFMQHVHPDDREAVAEAIGAAIADKSSFSLEHRIVRADGEERVLRSEGEALLDEKTGGLAKLFGIAQDITERKRMEEELSREREFLNAMLESLSEGIVACDAQGNLSLFNQATREFHGLPEEEIRPDEWAEHYGLYQADGRTVMRKEDIPLFRAYNGENVHDDEMVIVPKDDPNRRLLANGQAFYDGEGNKLGAVVAMHDITARKRAEEEVRRSERRFRCVVEQAADAMLVHDLEGRYVDVNRRACESLGYTREELLGMSVPDIEINFDLGTLRSLWQEMVPGSPVTLDGVHRRKDGTLFPVEVRLGIFESEGRQLLLALARDITERRRAEEKLKESEERYRAVIEQSADAIWLFDPDTKQVLESNAALRELLGYTAEEFLGMTLYDFVAHDKDDIDLNVQRSFLQEKHVLGERKYRRKDGALLDLEVSGTVISYRGKEVVCAMARDLTERKQAEEALRKSEANLTAAQRIARLGSWEWDVAEDTLFWSEETYRSLGIDREVEPSYELFLNSIHPEDREYVQRKIGAALEGREPYEVEFRVVWPTGEERVIHSQGEVFFGEDGEPARLQGTHHDVTERKRAEEEIRRLNENLERKVAERTAQLEASEAELRALFGAMNDVILVLDSEGRYLRIAPTNTSLLYKSSEELEGKTLHETFPREQADAFLEHIRRALKTRELVSTEYSLRIGDEEVWFAGTISPMAEDTVVYVARDITYRKRAEENLRLYAEKLAQSNRELQDFAFVASHDLQEPLRKVRAFGDRLRAKYADVLGDQGRDYIERMEGAAARMQDLIEDLLVLSRVTSQARPFAPVDLGEVVQDVLSDLETRIEQAGGRVEVGELPTVEADRSQMRQLLQNLIGNALKFYKEGEAPVVSVRGRALANREGPLNGSSADGEACQIIVEDNGIGFEEKYLGFIFAPFQRLDSQNAYEGTGMGLAICRKVVERHGGQITAKSATGRGATFIVTLPVKQSEKETRTARGKADDHATAGR